MIAVIGAGPAGVEAASCLASAGEKVMLFEKTSDVAANLRDKALLFPDFIRASEFIDELAAKIASPNIQLITDCNIASVELSSGTSYSKSPMHAETSAITSIAGTSTHSEKSDSNLHGSDSAIWTLKSSDGRSFTADKVLLATGYRTFDARRKEELGYGIYKGVITSLEMEEMLRNRQIVNTIGEAPSRVVFLQCVGSRDAKVGNHYCSKLCCVTAVKQAMEVRELVPGSEVYVFYMDLRMWGQGFEEMYRRSQQDFGVNYIRGRISEAAGTFDGKVQIKAEDTLTGIPLKMTTDLLVLMVGMEASDGTRELSKSCGICGEYGFAKSIDCRTKDNLTDRSGLFLAGSCKRPMCISDVIADARSAAFEILHACD